jgi:hypothetical protein
VKQRSLEIYGERFFHQTIFIEGGGIFVFLKKSNTEKISGQFLQQHSFTN